MKTYRDLNVWKEAMNLVTNVYKLTQIFPREELYGLTSQMRRAAVSIPSNIAEGHQRNSTKEYIHFLSIARGSIAELETQLMIAEQLNYIQISKLESIMELTQKTGNLLGALMKALGRKI
ncbi:MAG: four helix bundle protein [Ignavibacteria bacterium]|nr:four helix bundle protein [Ignavibacteria bacterium]